MANEIPTTQQLEFLRYLQKNPRAAFKSLAEIAEELGDRKRIAVWMMFDKLQAKGWVKERQLTPDGRAWLKRLG